MLCPGTRSTENRTWNLGHVPVRGSRKLEDYHPRRLPRLVREHQWHGTWKTQWGWANGRK